MSQDVAALGFSVDSSQVVTAGRNLDGMRASADGMSRSSQLLTLQHAEHRAALVQLSQATQSLNRDFSDTETALDSLIRKLDDSRKALGAFNDGMPDFSRLQTQVEQVGQTFGVTSTQLEGYYRTAQQLAFTTPQTVQSITRITEALQNQSLVGQQVRRVLQDYGVDLAGKTTGDAAGVLQQFTQQLRTTADSAQKYRSVQQVLGPIDTDTFGKINSTDYVTLDEKRSRQIQQATDQQIQDRTRNSAILTRQTAGNDAQYQDLSNTFNLGGGGIGKLAFGQNHTLSTGLTPAQRTQLAKAAGVEVDSVGLGYSQSDQLKMLQYLQANPTSELSKSAYDDRRPEAFDTASKRLFTAYGNGTISANASEISARFGQDRQNNGLFSAVGNNLRYGIQNALNEYQPLDPIKDTRKRDPVEQYLQDSNTANTLSGYGDSGFARRLQATTALQSFTLNTDGSAGNDKTRDAFKSLTSAYGTTEGTQRFQQIQGRLTNARDDALSPGAGALSAGRQTAFLLSLPREQRGQAQNYLDFAQQNGVPLDQFFKDAQSDPSGALQRVLTPNVEFGPGAMTHSQGQGFRDVTDQGNANTYAASRDQFKQTVSDQQQLTDAASKGSASLEDQTTKQSAYNQALAERKTKTQAVLEGDQAVYELNEKRKTQATEQIAQLQQENKIETDRLAAVNKVGGDDAVGRSTATVNAQIAAEVARSKNANPQTDTAALSQEKRVAVGNQAISIATELTAKDQQSLKQQQDLLSVATSRADVQAKYARDQQVEVEFTQSMANARASGDNAAIAAVQRQIDLAKQLRDELARVNQEAKNFQIGRDARDNAAFDTQAAGITDPQQRRLFLQNRQNYMDNRATTYGTGGTQPSDYTNNNPTNLRYYPGQQGVQGSTNPADPKKGFGVYATPEDGIAAGLQQMLLDQSRGFDTITKEITLRSPSSENNTALLIKKMSAMTGMDPDAQYNLKDPAVAARFVSANIQAEGNKAPSADLVNRGVALGLGNGQTDGQSYRQQKVQNADDASARLGVANSSDADAARLRLQQQARDQDPGQAARTRAGYVDPNGNPITTDYAAQQATSGVIEGQRDQAAQASRASLIKAADDKRAADAYTQSRAAVAKENEDEQIAAAQRQLGPGIVDPNQKRAELQGEEVGGLAKQIGQNTQQTQEATQDAIKLADAWKQGTAAALEQQRALETAPIEREIQSLKDRGVNVASLTEKYKQLVAQKTADARASQDQQIYTKVSGMKDQDSLAQQDNDLGPFVSAQQLARSRALAAAQQDLSNKDPNASPGAKQAMIDQVNASQDIKEQTQQVQQYRDAWKQVEDASFSALNGMIINGGSAKQTIAELGKSLANMLLQIAETPLKNAAGNWLGGLLGFGASATTAAPSLGNGAVSSAMMAAAGGAWIGGTRMMAAGDILDRPTKFFSAGGQTNVAGEMGTEAIMPLRRMPDGNLGIAASGAGGSGHSVQVNAPITITGGQMQNGQMDAASTAALQAQLSETVRVAVVQGIANEKRPGGSLYN